MDAVEWATRAPTDRERCGNDETRGSELTQETDVGMIDHGTMAHHWQFTDMIIPADRVQVLAVLDRAGRALSGRTIARLTESVSPSTVNRILRALVRSGVVHEVPGGYSINRHHLGYPVLQLLLRSTEEFTRRIVELVGSWTVQPDSLWWFGSTARGDGGASSDVDLLLVRPVEVEHDQLDWANDVATLAQSVRSWTGRECDILEYDSDELAYLVRVGDPIIHSITTDGICLIGDTTSLVAEATVP